MSVPQVPFILFKGGTMPDVKKKKVIDKIKNKPREVPNAIVPIGENNNWYKSLLISLKNPNILDKIKKDVEEFYQGTWLDDKTSINSIIEAYLTKDGNWDPESWGSKDDLIDIFKENIKKLLISQQKETDIDLETKPSKGFGKKVPRDVEEIFGIKDAKEIRENFKGNYVFLPVAITENQEIIYFIIANFISPYFPTTQNGKKKVINVLWTYEKFNNKHIFQYDEFKEAQEKKFLNNNITEILKNHQKDTTIKITDLKVGSFIMKTREGKIQYLPFHYEKKSKPQEMLLESVFITLISDEAEIDEKTGLYRLSKEAQSVKPASILSIADVLVKNEKNEEVKKILEKIKLPKLSSKIEENAETHIKRENSGSLMGTLSLDKTREKYEENDKTYETELMKRLRESILRLIKENNKNFVEKKFFEKKEDETNAKKYINENEDGKWLYQQIKESEKSIKMVSLRSLVSDFNKNKENSALNEIIKNMDTFLGGNNKSRKNRKNYKNKTQSKH